MPVCGDPSCSCHRLARRRIYKSPLGSVEAVRRQDVTLARLAKVSDLTIEHRNKAVWLAVDGPARCWAPIMVLHGAISLRTEFPSLAASDALSRSVAFPVREVIPVPANFAQSPSRIEALAQAIRKSHKAYGVYAEQHERLEIFRSIVGRHAHVRGLDGDKAVVEVRVDVTFDHARELRHLLDATNKKE